jgi:hypothetical protein
VVAHVGELAAEGVGRGKHGGAQSVEQAADAGRDGRPRGEVAVELAGDVLVDGLGG